METLPCSPSVGSHDDGTISGVSALETRMQAKLVNLRASEIKVTSMLGPAQLKKPITHVEKASTSTSF